MIGATYEYLRAAETPARFSESPATVRHQQPLLGYAAIASLAASPTATRTSVASATPTQTSVSDVSAAQVTPPSAVVLPSAGTGSALDRKAWWVLLLPFLVFIGSEAALARQFRASS